MLNTPVRQALLVLLGILLGFFTISITSILSQIVSRDVLSDPGFDQFYQPPVGFESTAPGTVLTSRTTTPAFFGWIPYLTEAYQLLYRSTAINGSAIAAMTTIFVPLFPYLDRCLISDGI